MDSTTDTDKAPVIWCLLDSRPGHRNQVLGLADAVGWQISVTTECISVRGVVHGFLTGLLPVPAAQKPDLIIAAGHSTHLPLLQLGRRFRAKTVILMKPSFPLQFFDLCLVPDVYDFRTEPDNLFRTVGVLNRIQPSDNHDQKKGLILVGGPSSHHEWSDDAVAEQMSEVLSAAPDMSWQIVTSRRTPESFVRRFRAETDVAVVTPDDVDAAWLPDQLQTGGTVWVTEDSVSMLYEAVTSGAATGILELPRTRSNRAVQCIDLLLDSKDVCSWSDWRQAGRLRKPVRRFCEADRCAAEILRRGLLPSVADFVSEKAA